ATGALASRMASRRFICASELRRLSRIKRARDPHERVVKESKIEPDMLGTVHLAMRRRGPGSLMNGPWALVSHGSSHVAPPPFPVASGAVYGSGTGPKSGGGTRCFVAASYAEAMRRSVGSEKGLPKN